ncbi:MAG: ATP-dependent DNA helicase [Flavobacteriales bacterium]
MLDREGFTYDLLHRFPFDPTDGQKRLLEVAARFLTSDYPNCTLVVRGYAGTGKTTCMGTLVQTLSKHRVNTVLLAPTGRAAKVFSRHAGKAAYTIHKRIYVQQQTGSGFRVQVAHNPFTNAVFIVDEASMIGSGGLTEGFGSRDLLEDLLMYVFSGQGCRLILVGDGAQLPPVGSPHSPGLDLEYLTGMYPITAARVELTEVRRQQLTSGILYNATMLRDQLLQGAKGYPQLDAGPFDDVIRIDGTELQDALQDEVDKEGIENVMVITRSNKRANQFNQQIRARLLWHEEELNGGDRLMVVRNNYTWLENDQLKRASFIANGDTVEVQRIVRYEEFHGLRYAWVEVTFEDYPDMPGCELCVLLDTLTLDSANLPMARMQQLFDQVALGYLDEGSRRKIAEAVKKDSYYSALQVKYGYAVTCHKSQGGQWPVVFVDAGYLNEDHLDAEYYRWLYTAVTRAESRLYLVNFPEAMYQDEGFADI